MEKIQKNKKMTIEILAGMVAKGFETMATKIDITEVKEDIKDVRRDILNLGDKFVSYHTFDSLAHRVKILEDKKK